MGPDNMVFIPSISKILSVIFLALGDVDAAFDLGFGDDSDLTRFVTVSWSEVLSEFQKTCLTTEEEHSVQRSRFLDSM
jgi:hypothetical protein